MLQVVIVRRLSGEFELKGYKTYNENEEGRSDQEDGEIETGEKCSGCWGDMIEITQTSE